MADLTDAGARSPSYTCGRLLSWSCARARYRRTPHDSRQSPSRRSVVDTSVRFIHAAGSQAAAVPGMWHTRRTGHPKPEHRRHGSRHVCDQRGVPKRSLHVARSAAELHVGCCVRMRGTGGRASRAQPISKPLSVEGGPWNRRKLAGRASPLITTGHQVREAFNWARIGGNSVVDNASRLLQNQ